MCGFVGFRTFTGDSDPLQRNLLAAMDQLRRRGPDGAGTWFSRARDVGLGHRRLAILDLSDAASQPMPSPLGTGVLVFNGEIYNHLELRHRAESRGRSLASHGDTAVLAALLEIDGAGALELLRGMFALAWYDSNDGSLLLARDRLGIKPLVYAESTSQVVFASTLAALRKLPGWNQELDPSARFEMLATKYVAAPRTIHRQGRQLLPGTWRRYDPAGRATQGRFGVTFGEAATTRAPASDAEFDALIDRLLRSSVEEQLVADVEVGAFLSGGVDSSLVAAYAQRACRDRGRSLRTIGVSFPEDPRVDEGASGAAVAAVLGTNHTILPLSAQDIAAELDQLWTACDQPFGDASVLPTMAMSRAARREVKVALSGDGGDETCLGYDRYFTWGRLDRFSRLLPRPLRRRLGLSVARVPGGRLDHVRAALFTAADPALGPLVLTSGAYAHAAAVVVGGSLDELFAGRPAEAARQASLRHPGDTLRAMADMDLAIYLPDDCLYKVDRASMHASLEVRVPLLDERLVEELAAAPTSTLRRGGLGKLPYRRLLERNVGKLVGRSKRGFGVPLERWIFQDWRDRTEANLRPDHVESCGLRVEGVAALVEAARMARWRPWIYSFWPLWAYLDWCRCMREQGAAVS